MTLSIRWVIYEGLIKQMYHRWWEEREDQGNGERGDEPCDLNCNCGMNTAALTATSVDKELQMYVCTHACTVCTSLCTCLEGSIHMHKFPNYIRWKGLVAIMSLCVCVCVSCSVMSNSLQPHGMYPTRFLCLWDFPGKNSRVDCHFLLQGIFPT